MANVRLPDHSVSGAGDITVFLLHGAFGAKEYWLRQIEALTNAGYRVVAWDAPGYGVSPLPADFSVETAARAAEALIRAESTERNIVLGHSMGGMIAQRCYSYCPDLIDGLVLSATSAAFGKSDGDWQQQFVNARVAPLDKGMTLPEFAPKMIGAMIAPDMENADIDRVVQVVSGMREETFRAAVYAITQFEGRDVLPTITAPTLCISGAHDLAAAPPKVMEKMAAKIAGSEYHCMEHVGHFGWAEDAEGFNALLLDFLDRRIKGATGKVADVAAAH
ncbi:alpha/beta hydrolase [Marivita sp. S6314]|uniref:alpha/beta fold hydrolase n=1 Tax=Marivita sp. S6314 TaxID=2926406 RepID=UPI001FF24F7B|nr:alpha/beta hydrolase [Marivita sp. S6314]MCK0151339.1 alpha/beta hydrolase [Marivita sp. S6314]